MEEVALWVGIDLGSAFHQFCVLDRTRAVRLEKRVAHEGAALSNALDEVLDLAAKENGKVVAAIETPTSAVVETMLERGIEVFAINPKQLDRFRDRYSVAGAKDDRRDAFVLADSLHTDAHCYRAVKLGPERIVELRELSRVHDELVNEETMLANRIDAELVRCFPELRRLGAVHTDDWMLELVELAPTPEQARRLPLGKVRGILKGRHVRRVTPEQVVDVLRGPTLSTAPGVATACARHIGLLAPRLRLVREQKRQCRRDLQQLLDELSEPAAAKPSEHRDAAILLSLPGVGTIVGATMLSEAWQPLVDRDYTRLRALCGSAPVTRRSGKTTVIVMRRACNPRLRQALYHWARTAAQNDDHTKERYRSLRARGHSHGRALRGVADRLLDLLVGLLRAGELFDPDRHGKKAHQAA